MRSLFKPSKSYQGELVIEFVNGFTRSKVLTTTAKDDAEAYLDLCSKVYPLLERNYILMDHKMYSVKQILSWNLHNVKEV